MPLSLTQQYRPEEPQAAGQQRKAGVAKSAARGMARMLAELMADGELSRLPLPTPHAPPDYVRDLLLAYYELRDEAAADVREHGASMTLRERIAAASVRQSIDCAIYRAERWLSTVARRGGCGLPPLGPKWRPREASA